MINGYVTAYNIKLLIQPSKLVDISINVTPNKKISHLHMKCLHRY